jgi:hypothetical protein
MIVWMAAQPIETHEIYVRDSEKIKKAQHDPVDDTERGGCNEDGMFW